MSSMSFMSSVSHVPGHDPDTYVWQDDAACAFVPAELFEVLDEEHPMTEDMDRTERNDFMMKNFEYAATVCARCPVLDQCEESATTADHRYTFRAGKMPSSVGDEVRSHRRKKPRDPVLAAMGRTCKRGHWVPAPSGGRSWQWCQPCKNETRRARKELLRSQGLSAKHL